MKVEKEIGGEFLMHSAPIGINTLNFDALFQDKLFILSGRTGLSIIADELKLTQGIKSIALPAYCCSTMIYPFYHKDIEVVFYSMPSSLDVADDKEISLIVDSIEDVDAVLVMDYFGYIRNTAFSIAQYFKAKGKVVIVDATQSAFSMSKAYEIADYMLISYRKWSDILAGVLYSKHNISFLPSKYHDNYVDTWRKAASLKTQHFNNEIADKNTFLQLYKEANGILTNEYEGFLAFEDDVLLLHALDTTKLIEQRRQNALHLINSIKKANIPDIQLMFSQLNKGDCPLFVPILLSENYRNTLHTKLIEKDIYCPIHWPINKKYPYKITKYHDCEISLICDQRYTISDMNRILEELSFAMDY